MDTTGDRDRAIAVEICAGDLRSALEAGEGGADRVELCDNLSVGGTTPSVGTIAEACRRLSIPVHVLIRPRAGDFLPDEAELAAMARDVDAAREHGAAGVVLGLLGPDGRVDRGRTAPLVERARPMRVTFHKAFDQVPDPAEALETLIEMGIDRVLTSGGRRTALEGAATLADLVRRAGGRIAVLVGGSLSLANLPTVVARTGAREVHLGSAACLARRSPMVHDPADGSDLSWPSVDAARVREIVAAVRRLSS